MPKKKVVLRVSESINTDTGIIRINTNHLTEIGARPEDILAIEGTRRTYAIAKQAYEGDIGMKIIRIDGVTRRNARTNIGEPIKISKAKLIPLNKMIVGSAYPNLAISATEDLLRRKTEGRAFSKGDVFSISTSPKVTKLPENIRLEEVFKVQGENFAGITPNELKLEVLQLYPEEGCYVDKSTQIILEE